MHRKPELLKGESAAIQLDGAQGRRVDPPEMPGKAECIRGDRLAAGGDGGPRVSFKFRPRLLAQSGTRAREDIPYQDKALPQQHPGLEFQIGGHQLEEGRPVPFSQSDLLHKCAGIGDKGIALGAIVQHPAQGANEINGGQRCAPVW